MKLIRWGEHGAEKPGLLDDAGQPRDASGLVPDWSGEHLLPERLAALPDPTTLPEAPAGARLGPCMARPGKIIAIGLNYSDHAKETGAELPKEPIIFMKATTSYSGPYDPVLLPRGSTKTDWEVELGVVVGKTARYVEEDAAAGHIAGYCVVHDVSEREHQIERCGQWVKGKSHDTFSPTGPWLVTADEVADPLKLRLWLEVDGKMRQDGNTCTMAFGPVFLVSYLSQFMTLEPGDLITTGTPPGVGMGCQPPEYLQAGMRVKLGVEGLGEQEQEIRAA